MTREEAWAIYDAQSKAGAAVCNAAHAAATRAYSEEMAKVYEAHRRGEIDQAAVTAAMLKADRRCDVACQRADAIYNELMKRLHEEYMEVLRGNE